MSVKFIKGKHQTIHTITTALNKKDTDDVLEELMITENLSLLYNFNNLPESLLMFWPPVL